MMRRALLAFAMVLLATMAHKARAAELLLNVGGVSWHDQAQGRNGHNPCAGLEARFSAEWAAGAGVCRSSQATTSYYAGGSYTPLHVDTPVGQFAAGIQAGGVSGYSYNGGRFGPAAAGLIEWRTRAVTVAVLAVPRIERVDNANTVAVQLKFSVGSL